MQQDLVTIASSDSEEASTLSKIVSDLGFHSHIAPSEDLLFQNISQNTPRLVIIGSKFSSSPKPRLTAMVSSKVSASPHPAKIILCVGDLDDESIQKSKDNGAAGFVQAPYRKVLIKDIVGSVLGITVSTNAEQNHLKVAKNLFRLMIHDVSNLFTNLDIYFSTANKDVANDIRQKRFQRAQRTVLEVKRMLKNVKTLDAIRSQDLVQKIESVDIKACAEEIGDLYLDRLEEKSLNLVYEFPSDLSLRVLADPLALKHQVMGNLLTNAIKFSNRERNITFRASESRDYIRFDVIDKGIGMSEKILKNLFNESKKHSRNGTQGEKGTGYGLQLVSEFVQAFDGYIEVTSEEPGVVYDPESQGTCFSVFLKKA
ncbi:MAG: HAMP domain-containing histidine kinase [Pseudobacteriovorax sp.]|nr:HAMP domain-containing histidine kinase [Pseudobacteriovorax sp.]